VETVWLKTLYVLFFIELGSRRVHVSGCTANPDAAWVTSRRGISLGSGRLSGARYGSWCGIGTASSPGRLMRCSAASQRVRGALDPGRCGRRSRRAPHPESAPLGAGAPSLRTPLQSRSTTRGLGLVAPAGPHQRPPIASAVPADVSRRDLLGGLLHEYCRAAA
jgi:hypothetical protein